jgi:hypothetical protein
LFGGVTDAGSTPLGDTWTWNGAAWTQQNVVGPNARGYASMATMNGTVVLCGGAGTGDLGGLSAFDDTWTWDGTRWSQQNVTGPYYGVGGVFGAAIAAADAP